MVNKEMIGYAILIGLILAGMAYFMLKGDTKTLQQKIMQTEQTVSSVRDMATTYAGLSVHKDFTGISMANTGGGASTNSTLAVSMTAGISVRIRCSFSFAISYFKDRKPEEVHPEFFKNSIYS